MRIDAVSLALILALAMAWVPLSTINALTDSAATAAGRGLVSKSSYRFSHQQDTNDYVAVFEPPLGMSKTEVRAAASALSHHAFSTDLLSGDPIQLHRPRGIAFAFRGADGRRYLFYLRKSDDRMYGMYFARE